LSGGADGDLGVREMIHQLPNRDSQSAAISAHFVNQQYLAKWYVAPAIANAVANAVGIRIRDLPITAEKVYGALNQQT